MLMYGYLSRGNDQVTAMMILQAIMTIVCLLGAAAHASLVWATSLIWVAEFEIGGRYFGRQNVHLWSARYAEKVRKRWTEKTKVRTWSGKSGLFTDLAIYIHTGVPGRRCECSHPGDRISLNARNACFTARAIGWPYP